MLELSHTLEKFDAKLWHFLNMQGVLRACASGSVPSERNTCSIRQSIFRKAEVLWNRGSRWRDRQGKAYTFSAGMEVSLRRTSGPEGFFEALLLII